MKLLFVTALGAEHGLGHYKRSRVLAAEAMAAGHQCDLWVTGDDSLLATHPWVPGGNVLGATASELTPDALAPAFKHQWLILDGYAFKGDDWQKLAHRKGGNIAVFDDLANRPLASDVVINQGSRERTLYEGSRVKGDEFMLGPRFAMVEPSTAFWREKNRAALKVLVTFGGSDLHNWTPDAVGLALALPGIGEVHVAVGPFSRAGQNLEPFRGDPRLRLHVGLTSLRPLLLDCDFTITAAGSALWEACYLGTPLVAVQTVDNQRWNAATVTAAQAALVLEHGKSRKTLAPLLAQIAKPTIRATLSQRARALVDGNGPQKVLEALLNF